MLWQSVVLMVMGALIGINCVIWFVVGVLWCVMKVQEAWFRFDIKRMERRIERLKR